MENGDAALQASRGKELAMPWIFQAAYICDKCGDEVVKALRKEGVEDDDDADSFPQRCSREDARGDGPEHCDFMEHCVDALEVAPGHRVGAWLENDLTRYGRAYVAAARGPVAEWWRRVYGLPFVLRDVTRRIGRKAQRPARRRPQVTYCGVDVERVAERLDAMGYGW